MNLHSIVGPYVGTVNPRQIVDVRVSIGNVQNADFTRTPAYATPGGLTGSIAGTVLTVSALSAGKLLPGQLLTAGSVKPNTTIIEQLTGMDGGAGTYEISQSQTVSSVAMTTSLNLLAQIQPLTKYDLMMLEGVSMNGEKNAIYVNGAVDGIVRVKIKGGDLVITPDGRKWLVVQNLEGWNPTAGWTKAAIVLQND